MRNGFCGIRSICASAQVWRGSRPASELFGRPWTRKVCGAGPGLLRMRCQGQTEAVCSRGGVPNFHAGRYKIEGRLQYCTASWRPVYLCQRQERLPVVEGARRVSRPPGGWVANNSNERTRAAEVSRGRRDTTLVLVKNEEIVLCSTPANQYLALYRESGKGAAGVSTGETGGTLHAWVRVSSKGICDLDATATALSSKLLHRLLGPGAGAAHSR